MRYIFFVQGEGRGHFSQALSLQAKLAARGHVLVAVISGRSRGEPPLFFQKAIGAPIFMIDSPGFVVDKQGEGIKNLSSLINALKSSPRYFQSLKKIRTIIQELNPAVIINFYEPLAGIYVRLWRDKRPMFCLAHQFFIDHPAWSFPPGDYAARQAFSAFNRLNAPRQAKRLALSFSDLPDIKEKNLFIVPPLIRPEVKEQTPSDQGFILAYLLNPGYQKQISDWSRNHPEIKIESFSDNLPEGGEKTISANLISHGLSGDKFLKKLAACRAYVSTAGFDSIAEAAYLGKDILMVPTKNHFEQKCNAWDAYKSDLALSSTNFDLDLITKKQPSQRRKAALKNFKRWVDDQDDKIIKIIENE